MPDFAGKENALDDVAINWAVRDPSETLRYTQGLANGREKEILLNAGLAQSAFDDAQAAQRFARQLPDAENRRRGLETVLLYWSMYDPVAAEEFLSSIAQEATPGSVANLAASLSERDPAASVRWLEAFPDSLDKAPAVGRIAENWFRVDPAAAEAWVRQYPAGPLHDAAAQGLCTALQGKLPQALTWARTIRDPQMCHDAVYQAFTTSTSFRYLDFGDPHGIKDDIRFAPELTEAEKNTLLARFPEPIRIGKPLLLDGPAKPAGQ